MIKAKTANTRCENYVLEANAMCKYICEQTTEIGGTTMRCRIKRHRRRSDDRVDSKFCGAAKCLSLRKKGKEFSLFVWKFKMITRGLRI